MSFRGDTGMRMSGGEASRPAHLPQASPAHLAGDAGGTMRFTETRSAHGIFRKDSQGPLEP